MAQAAQVTLQFYLIRLVNDHSYCGTNAYTLIRKDLIGALASCLVWNFLYWQQGETIHGKKDGSEALKCK